ncbi:MAG: MarR family transcriptional regulator [Actinobacteria bacterium]|nr:MarR family transcriptional regulator [Actinomycetota bacterium]
MSQVLSEQVRGVRAFAALLKAHASVTSRLNALLAAEHGLTINDYEVLLRLSHAPERKLRRVDLADQVVLTASGITRLLDGLESCGFVERAPCGADRRVVYAVLTDAGLEKLKEAASTHVPQVDALFAERFDEDEIATAAALLERLGDRSRGENCAPGGD